MLDTPADAPSGVRVRLGRLGPLLLVGQLAWALPGAAGGTLLAALLAATDPAHKVGVFTAYSVAGAVTSAAGTLFGGLWCDRTRARFAGRSPWLLGSAVLAAVALAGAGRADGVLLTGVCYAVFQLGIGTWTAALSALIPDHVPAGATGRASAFAGLGYLAGQTAGGVLAGVFVTAPADGLLVAPWLLVVAAVAIAVALPRDRRGAPAPVRRPARRDLVPRGSRDFWLAFAGRFLFILAVLLVTVLQLYLLTDALHLSTAAAGDTVGTGTALLGVLAAVAVVVCGPLSDRVRRTKPFVVGASVLLAAGLVPLLVAPGVGTDLVFFAVAGLALGAYLSVDQVLMVAVLPDRDSAARDLGVLTVGSTLPGVVAPIVGGALAGSAGYGAIFAVGIGAAVAAAVVILGIRSVR